MFTFRTLKQKTVMPLAGVLLMAATAVSCQDEDSNNTGAAVTEAEAADAIEAAVTTESNGVAKMASDAGTVATTEAVYTNSPDVACGQQYSDTHSAIGSGANYSYDYEGSHSYELSCNELGLPDSFAYSYTMAGTYDTPRLYSDDTASADVAITGLSSGTEVAVINGTYTRNGYQESKVRQLRHFNSLITINLAGVSINKTTQQIAGGTASVIITGTGSGGGTFSYDGAITFNGNQTATLVINGNTYTINL